MAETLEEILQEGSSDEGDAPFENPTLEEISKARQIAAEECLHTIANFALELEAGKRESITAEDIRIAFASHEVDEIWTEAKIFFVAAEEDTDITADGENGPNDEDEDESEDES